MVVERYVGLDVRCEFAIGLELTQIVPLDFQGTPKILNRGVVETTSDPGHIVGQPCVFHHALEPARGILEPSVTMDYRTRFCAEPRDGWDHRLEDEPVIVGFPDAIGNNRAVIEIDDRAQICLPSDAIFELGDVGALFLIRSGRAKFSVHQVLGPQALVLTLDLLDATFELSSLVSSSSCFVSPRSSSSPCTPSAL